MTNPIESLSFIGERLRSIRKSRGLSQQEVAERMGLPQSNLSRIENGKQRLNLTVLAGILTIYQMSLDDFFSGQDASRPIGEREARVLTLFRSLTSEEKTEVEDYLEFKSKRNASSDPSRKNEVS